MASTSKASPVPPFSREPLDRRPLSSSSPQHTCVYRIYILVCMCVCVCTIIKSDETIVAAVTTLTNHTLSPNPYERTYYILRVSQWRMLPTTNPDSPVFRTGMKDSKTSTLFVWRIN